MKSLPRTTGNLFSKATFLHDGYLEFVLGSVIQATERTEFEDGSRIGIQSEVRNGLQSTCTIPEVNMASHPND